MSFSYLPDLSPDTKDIWTACDGFHADRQGNYRTGWLATDFSAVAGSFAYGKAYVTAANTKGILLIHPGGSAINRVMGVYNGSSWSDRTNATSTIATHNAAICQYGNITLVGTDGLMLQRDATGTSNFATIASSPVAQVLLSTPYNIIVALGSPTFLAGISTGSDGWATSDTGDYSNWTTGEAASGNLRQTPGPIVAGGLVGNDVIAFKRRGVYRGTYVGGTVKWAWQLIHPAYGAWGPGAVCSAEGRLYFYGPEGFFRFDGSGFERMDMGIETTLLTSIVEPNGLFGNLAHRTVHLVYDSINSRVCVFNPGGTNNGVTRGGGQHFSLNIVSGAWGYQSQITDVAASFPGATDVANAVIDDAAHLNTFTTNGQWVYDTNIFIYGNDADAVRALTTEVSPSLANYVPKLRTHRLGSRDRITRVKRFIPNWTLASGAGTDLSTATTKTATPYTSDSAMEAETAQTVVNLSTDLNRADFLHAARFVSVELKVNCESVIAGGQFLAETAGFD